MKNKFLQQLKRLQPRGMQSTIMVAFSVISISITLILGIVIIVHELGHFVAAKLNGIMVEEFSVGMGPRIISTQRGETLYSLRVVPFGGSCMMKGEDEAADWLSNVTTGTAICSGDGRVIS